MNDAVAHVIQGGDWGIDVQGGALVNEVSEASSYVLRNGDIISFAAQEELPCFSLVRCRGRRPILKHI